MSGTTPVSMADLLAASGAARAVSTPPPPEPAAEDGLEEPAEAEAPQPCPTAAAA